MRLVLLHAFPLDERMWEPQLRSLGGAHEVVAPRLYGRGRSMDEWAASLLDELEGELVPVGASMGGYCALALARLAPERVHALVLAGSRADADSPERRAGRADTIDLIGREGAAGLWRAMRPKLFGPAAPAEAVARAEEIALEQEPEELLAAVEAIRDRPDSTETATAIPLALVLGDEDPFVDGGYAAELAASSPQVRRVILPGCGHLPNMERPQDFDDALRRVLDGWR